MNNYKFGNYICKLREELGMTQSELAKKLNISDKAISKWENGQAFPRKDTFEKLACSLNTTVEDIFSASKDEISRVCFVNNFCSIMHIDINGQLYCLRNDESKWVEISDDPIIIKITGDLTTDNDFKSETQDSSFKDAILSKAGEKSANYILSFALQADCVYRISEIEPDMIISIDADFFDLGDKTLMCADFLIVYPKINLAVEQIELLSAKGKNSKEIVKKYKKMGLLSDLSAGFIPMLLFYPVRGLYFKHLCKPTVLKKNIINVHLHKEKTQKSSRKKLGCLSTLILIALFFVLELFVFPVSNIDSEKPALLSADYSTITYGDEVYIRIDHLPDYAEAQTLLGATIWEDVRKEGLSKTDQFFQDDKVMLFEDYEGRKYLWLVEDYGDTMLTGEEKDYDDFSEHYVYMFDSSE